MNSFEENFKLFLKKYNLRNSLIVTGKKSFKLSGAEKIINNIISNDNFFVFNEFEENPKLKSILRGIDLFNQNKCDSIIAIGGGTAIDIAKLISCFLGEDLTSEENIIDNKNRFIRKVPLMVIPTTAGSGSEETSFAVIYINKTKFSVSNPSLIPDNLILDASLSYTMSPQQKAISGLDVFCQAIESYWSNQSTDESRKFSLDGLELVWNNLYNSYKKNCFHSHQKVFLASNLVGKAINIAKTTSAHAISYYFTSNHGVRHGHAVSLFIGKIYDYNYALLDSSDSYKKNIFKNLNAILGIDSKKPSTVINKFIKSLDVEIDFQKLGIDIKLETDKILESINIERLKNNPFELDLKTFFNEYEKN